jgi:hypothetical protein
MKKQALLTPGQKVSLFGATLLPASLAAGTLASWNVRRQAFDDIPTTEKAVRKLARKHLGGNIEVRAVDGLGNAFYTTENDEAGNRKHVITYDPRVNLSVIAHEIGHGLKPIPRVPLSGLLGPALMSTGMFNLGSRAGLGQPLRGRDALLAALGAAAYAPTLLSEYAATSEAKNVLGEQPKGLGSAYMTYALPPLLAGTYGLGAYAIGRRARGESLIPMMKTSEAYLAGFLQKCAQAGFDADLLLRQIAPARWTPNIDGSANQGMKPVPMGNQEGTFGVPGSPLQARAKDVEAQNTLQTKASTLPTGTSNLLAAMKPAVSEDSGMVATAQAKPNSAVGGAAKGPPASAAPASAGAANQAAPNSTPGTPVTQTSAPVASAVQSLQNQTKAIPGAAALGQTPAGRAVQNLNGGILNAFNPEKAIKI